jgi:hypothetical protein
MICLENCLIVFFVCSFCGQKKQKQEVKLLGVRAGFTLQLFLKKNQKRAFLLAGRQAL